MVGRRIVQTGCILLAIGLGDDSKALSMSSSQATNTLLVLSANLPDISDPV